MAQRVKRLTAMWETSVRSLGWEDPVEKEMETHSSTLVWRIPWWEEQSMGSQRVRHNWATSLCQCRRRRTPGFNPWVGKIPWRRKWQPTLILCLGNPMNGEACRLQSLGGYNLWGRKESDTTVRLHFHFQRHPILKSENIFAANKLQEILKKKEKLPHEKADLQERKMNTGKK